jgi:hypothetical protein
VQSHTFWHPNFKHEAKRLNEDNYKIFVDNHWDARKRCSKTKCTGGSLCSHGPSEYTTRFWKTVQPPWGMRRRSQSSVERRPAQIRSCLYRLALFSDEYVGPRFLSFIKAAEDSVK